MTKDHNRAVLSTETCCLPALEARSTKLRCRQGGFPLRPGRICTGLSPWLVEGHLLSVSLQITFPLYPCIHTPPLYRDTGTWKEGPAQWPHFNLMNSTETLLPNRITF